MCEHSVTAGLPFAFGCPSRHLETSERTVGVYRLPSILQHEFPPTLAKRKIAYRILPSISIMFNIGRYSLGGLKALPDHV